MTIMPDTHSKAFFKIFIIILISAVIVTTMGCGPSKKELAEKAERERREAQLRRTELRARKSILADKAKKRIEAGEQQPPKVEDPGHKLALCSFSERFPYQLQTANGLVIVRSPIVIGEPDVYICVNNAEGKALLSWRKWYCEGEYDPSCVLSKWVAGQPTFGDYVGTETYNFGNNIWIELNTPEFYLG